MFVINPVPNVLRFRPPLDWLASMTSLLDQLCYGQDRLAELCPDRPLETDEYHTPNDYYGQASVMKRYAGLPESYCLKGVLEHGVVCDERVWEYDRDQQLPWMFAASQGRAAQLRRLTRKHVEPVGFGFLYARALVRMTHGMLDNARREGTIVFPCHSTHTVTASYDHEAYAERLTALPPEAQPVSVCLYWRNFEFGHHEIYQRAGIPVFSAGHMFDRDFLLRFYDLCRRFRYAASNVFGTHYFQAVASGCEFFHAPSEEIAWDVPDLQKEGAARGTPLGEYDAEIRESSQQPLGRHKPAQQQRVAAEVLGESSFCSPAGLRTRLEQAAWADRLAPTQVRIGAVRFPGPPTLVRRRMRFVGRIQRSIRKRLPWRKAA